MKIGNPSDKPVQGTGGGTKTEANQGTTTSPRAGVSSLDDGVEASAKVSLSNLAGNLLGGADPTFDAEKVQSVKAAIDQGTYQVNPGAIADKLIANARELLVREQA